MSTMTTNEAIRKLEEVAHRATSEERAARIVSAAKTRLILSKDARAVFFASLVLRLEFSADWNIETAATDGRRLVYNPDFVQELTEQELIGLLAHEVLHCSNRHCTRRASRDPHQWNVACDLAINPLLTESGFTLPDGALFPGEGPYAKIDAGRSAEEIFTALTAKPEEQPQEPGDDQQGDTDQDDQAESNQNNPSNQPGDDSDSDDSGDTDQDGADSDAPGDAPGNQQGAPDPGRCGGVMDPTDDNGRPVDLAEARQLDQEWKANVSAAQQIAERRGTLPAGIARMIGELLAPEVDWKAALREFMTRNAKSNYNWKRPNRRFVHAGIYLPSRHSQELGHVIAAIDTSGSIGEATLSRFAAELQDICEQGIERLTILYHDAEIVRVDEWTPDDGPLTLTPCGGGGTDHNPVFEWIEENTTEAPAVLVCLTDLWSDFPHDEPAYPVLWASIDPRKQHPFGERIDIPAE